MAKGVGKVDKLAEVLYRTLLSSRFQKEVARIRAEFNIPQPSPKLSRNENVIERPDNLVFDAIQRIQKTPYHKAIENLGRMFGLPRAADLLLETYVKSGWIPGFHGRVRYDMCELDRFNHLMPAFSQQYYDDEFKARGIPYVRVYIPSFVNCPEAQHFLKEVWDLVKEQFHEQGSPKSPHLSGKIRHTLLKERARRTIELSAMSREALGARWKETRYSCIARLLQDEGFGAITGERVKKIISKIKKGSP